MGQRLCSRTSAATGSGTAGLELLGAQSYVQQIFYGAALVVAITIPKVNRERIFKRRRAA
jgi:ribose transport system permease protein